jgi:hypothetical protein
LFGSEEDSQLKTEGRTQAAIVDSLPTDVRRVFRYSALLDRMQRGEAMLLMPYELTIK